MISCLKRKSDIHSGLLRSPCHFRDWRLRLAGNDIKIALNSPSTKGNGTFNIKPNKRIFVRLDMNLLWLTTLYNTTSRFKERSSQQFLPYSDPDRDLFLPRNQNTTIHLFAHLLLCMENCNCCRLQTLIPFGQCCNQKNRAARKCSMLFRGQPIKGPP